MAAVKHAVDRKQLTALLLSQNGGVAKDMLRRGYRVASRAKKNLERNPRRVDTGALRASIQAVLVSVNGSPAVRIGANRQYAVFVHDGTGLYGPKRQLIKPKTKKALRFKVKNKVVFAKSTKGMRPNPFLRDAITAAKG